MASERRAISEKPPCSCAYCVMCCHHKPGMMQPGEEERIAAHLGLTVEDLFKQFLAVDVVHDQDRDTYTLLPAIVQAKNAGGIYRAGEGGTCVFLKDGLCSIHPVKPWECRVTDHTTPGIFSRVDESAWARPWREHQGLLEALVGHPLPQRAATGIPDWTKTSSLPIAGRRPGE